MHFICAPVTGAYPQSRTEFPKHIPARGHCSHSTLCAVSFCPAPGLRWEPPAGRQRPCLEHLCTISSLGTPQSQGLGWDLLGAGWWDKQANDLERESGFREELHSSFYSGLPWLLREKCGATLCAVSFCPAPEFSALPPLRRRTNSPHALLPRRQ